MHFFLTIVADVHYDQTEEYKKRINRLDTLNEEFYDRYRFPKNVFIVICDTIRR